MDSLVRHRRSKVAETDRLILTVQLPVLYSTRNSIQKLPEITMQDKQEINKKLKKCLTVFLIGLLCSMFEHLYFEYKISFSGIFSR